MRRTHVEVRLGVVNARRARNEKWTKRRGAEIPFDVTRIDETVSSKTGRIVDITDGVRTPER